MTVRAPFNQIPEKEISQRTRRADLLSTYMALDLCDEKGFFCGKLLSDIGANVIKLEKPGGSAARNIGPFYGDVPDPEKSLFWWAFNMNKKGITLNIETADGKEIFKKLVRKADILIESFAPGYLDGLGLGYSQLTKINPSLIMVAITPFGQTGPYRNFKASDLICMAMGGLMYLTGSPDRPPVRISSLQSYLQAGAEAATGALSALYYRGKTGRGQFVDVSIQASLVTLLLQARLSWEIGKKIYKRSGQIRGGFKAAKGVRIVWPCQDGYVCFNVSGGPAGVASNKGIKELMRSEGLAPPLFDEIDWDKFNFSTATQEEIDAIEEPIAKFFMKHTKKYLDGEAEKRRILLFPLSTVEDIWNNPQLKARDFWVGLEHSELNRTVTYQRPCLGYSKDSLQLMHRAPLIGEHNEEIYSGELGFSNSELMTLKGAGVI
jgi:benzylsuccinate CoA-transferase BbsE subunit